MSYSIAQVRQFDFSAMHAAQTAAKADAQRIEDAVTQVQNGRNHLLGGWTGDAQGAADTRTSSTKTAGMTLVEEAEARIRQIGIGAEDLAHARQQVLQTVTGARSAGFNVDEQTGHVTPKSIPHAHQGGLSAAGAAIAEGEQRVAAALWQARIHMALARFEMTDDQVAGSLGGSPDAANAQQAAMIAQVDAGHMPANPIEALKLPWQTYTQAGRAKIAEWARAHRHSLGLMVAAGHHINLPPVSGGYQITIPAVESPWIKLTYAVAIPAATGVAGLTFAVKKGGKPSLSGSLQDGDGSVAGDVSDDGFAMKALDNPAPDGKPGISGGVEWKPGEGPWLVAKANSQYGQPGHGGTVESELDYRPDKITRFETPNPVEHAVYEAKKAVYEGMLNDKDAQHWVAKQWHDFWRYENGPHPHPPPVPGGPHAPNLPESGFPGIPGIKIPGIGEVPIGPVDVPVA